MNNKKADTIDVGKVNDKLFLGTCGFGFDAHIAKKFDEYHKRGFLSYIKLVIKEFRNYIPHDYQIEIDGNKSLKKAFMLSVANSSQFGNGFTISPMSELTDGKFELIVLKPFKWYNAPSIARKFFSKSIHHSKYFEQVMFDGCLKLSLPKGTSATLHIDGEPSGMHETFQVEILKSSLLLI